MPKNKGKGGKNRRRGKNENDNFKRELAIADLGQTYAQVLKMLGSANVEALCADKKKRICHIRGKMNKKIWINVGDIILVSVRDFQEEKADIIMKYTNDEAQVLKNRNLIPDTFGIGEANQFGQENLGDEIFFSEYNPQSEDKNNDSSQNNADSYPDNYISSDYSEDENLSDI